MVTGVEDAAACRSGRKRRARIEMLQLPLGVEAWSALLRARLCWQFQFQTLSRSHRDARTFPAVRAHILMGTSPGEME